MFNRGHEIKDIVDTLEKSVRFAGISVQSPPKDVCMQQAVAETRAILARDPNRAYTFLDARRFFEFDAFRLDPGIIIGFDGEGIVKPGIIPGWNIKSEGVGLHLSYGDEYFAHIFQGMNRIVIDGKVLSNAYQQLLHRLAASIDTMIDNYATLLVAGDVYMPASDVVSVPEDIVAMIKRGDKQALSHDCPCLENPTGQDANVLMRVVYQDGRKPVEYGWTIQPHKSLHARLDLLRYRDTISPLVARDCEGSVEIYTDCPAVTGVMSRGWFRDDKTLVSFMSAPLMRAVQPTQDRMLVSHMEERIAESRKNCTYKGE